MSHPDPDIEIEAGDDLVGTKYLARRLGCTQRSIFNLLRAKKLREPIQVNRRNKWHRADAERDIAALKAPRPAAKASGARIPNRDDSKATA